MRVEHEMCRIMCGTPVQAISTHKILTRVAGGVTEGQNLPQKWLCSPRETLNGSRTPEMDPKWPHQLPLIDLSPFPGPLAHLGASRELRSQILTVSRQILTIPDPHCQPGRTFIIRDAPFGGILGPLKSVEGTLQLGGNYHFWGEIITSFGEDYHFFGARFYWG